MPRRRPGALVVGATVLEVSSETNGQESNRGCERWTADGELGKVVASGHAVTSPLIP